MVRRPWLLAAVVLTSLSAPSAADAQGAAAASALTGEEVAAGLEVASEPSGTAVANPMAAFNPTTVFGISGALRVAIVPSSHPVDPAVASAAGHDGGRPRWVPLHGTVRRGLLGEPVGDRLVAPDGPGVWRLESDGSYVAAAEPLALITPVPFSEKRGTHLNGYHIGFYPTEGGQRTDVYAPPPLFIEVTPENQDLHVSRHLRLRQFLTKDQFDVWPKYLALNLRLVDKLELVIQELNAMGVRALDLHVMSGFRTPQYNGPGGDGRATLSRHMYGDAADIWVDGDRDGYIDDLNGDGRSDIRDAEVLLRAVERVEQKYPELTGGAGLYEANEYHGPYVHVDVRGRRARW